jgi:hypothetical protein
VTDLSRCPDCGRERPAGTSPVGLCPFCLLQLGLDTPPGAPSPWLDPESWSCRVLNVLDVEDGMTSYLAEQVTPARRLVVLAELEADLHSDEARSRFDAALATLVGFNHALIARAIGGLRSAAGTVYLVSEHVAGTSIARYCDRTNSGARERAALWLSVVEAVQAAHGRGLVHGRLAGAHVIVTNRRGGAAPAVTGLGVALLAGKAPGVPVDIAALADLGRALGLELPPRPCHTAHELADWVRKLC